MGVRVIVAGLGKRIAMAALLCAAFVQAAGDESGEELRIYASGPSVHPGEGEDVRAYQLASATRATGPVRSS